VATSSKYITELSCVEISVPKFLGNCVLGNQSQADPGQGWLNLRANFSGLGSIVGIRRKGGEEILFPVGKDVIHEGDIVLFPKDIKGVSSSRNLGPALERFLNPQVFKGLCDIEHSRLAVDFSSSLDRVAVDCQSRMLDWDLQSTAVGSTALPDPEDTQISQAQEKDVDSVKQELKVAVGPLTEEEEKTVDVVFDTMASEHSWCSATVQSSGSSTTMHSMVGNC